MFPPIHCSPVRCPCSVSNLPFSSSYTLALWGRISVSGDITSVYMGLMVVLPEI